MKYMLFVCVARPADLEPEEKAKIGPDVDAWVLEMGRRGVLLEGGHELAPISEARTVRVREGELLVTDGPFAETKEQIGGFDILECAGMDEAIEVASKHPVARFGTIELRPFWEG